MKILIKEKNSYTRLLAIRLANDLKAEIRFAEDMKSDDPEPDFILTEEESELPSDGRAVPDGRKMPVRIPYSKMAPASLLIQKIRSIWLSLENEMQELPVLAVTSACGGQGTTMAALALCTLLHKNQQRVLFLSFDPYISPPDKCIYELLAGKPGGGEHLLYMPAPELDLSPVENRLPSNCLNQMSSQEMKCLFRSIHKYCRGDVLVVDIPFSSPHWSLCTMLSDEQFLVKMVPESSTECPGDIDGKFELVKEQIQTVTGGLSKIHIVHNERTGSAYDAYQSLFEEISSMVV